MSPPDFFSLLPLILLGMGGLFQLLAGVVSPRMGSGSAGRISGSIIGLLAAVAALVAPDYPGGVVGLIETTGPGRFVMVLAGFTVFFILLLSIGYSDRREVGEEEYPALVLFGGFGMAVVGSAASLLGVFLGIECLSLSFYILLASEKKNSRSGEAGLKYLLMGAVSSAFLAFGLSLIYAGSGTLSIPEAVRGLSIAGEKISAIGLAGWGFLLVGIGFKLGLVPFHLWAPDVYEGAPAPIAGFLSSGSKAAVFIILLRLHLMAGDTAEGIVPLLWVLAASAMIYGNIAALAEKSLKRLLAWSSIGQMGYLMTGLIAAPGAGSDSFFFYVVAYVVAEVAVFGAVASLSGEEGDPGPLDSLRGIGHRHPLRGAAIALGLLSLAGLPPTAGFIGKFGIFSAAFKAGHVGLAVIGVLTAIVSVYYYARVVVLLYQRSDTPPLNEAIPLPAGESFGRLGLFILSGIMLFLGVMPEPMLDLARRIMGS